ncbi:bifunctional folylpolyglutamate synthase/dihydrofolate synthase [Halovulum sp. GXIMD14793]
MTAEHSDVILDRMMSLHPKFMDLTLDRMWRILAALDHPEQKLPPVIHVAGTNGKGSTIAMIRAGLEGAGDRVHVYTSPHLARFHERIRLAGDLISEEALSDVLAECEAANGPDQITYFEITTAAGLLAFSWVPADWTLLEVGLGGRLDATNVITPALSVITPVSIDHQQYLGDTLAEIAGEKAGILKPGVPCIVGPQQDEALEVIEARAEAIGTPLHIANRDWQVWAEHGRLVFQDNDGLLDLPLPVLIGAHQIDNAGTAIAALRALNKGDPEAAVTNAEWPARLQRLRHGPLVEAAGQSDLWLDGGHNKAAGAALAKTLTTLNDRPINLVCGMLKTKDARGYMRHLAGIATQMRTVSIPGEQATLTAEETADAARSVGMKAASAADTMQAVKEMAEATPGCRILICGSLYLAGQVLRENG